MEVFCLRNSSKGLRRASKGNKWSLDIEEFHIMVALEMSWAFFQYFLLYNDLISHRNYASINKQSGESANKKDLVIQTTYDIILSAIKRKFSKERTLNYE